VNKIPKVLITGSTDGIGKQTAEELAENRYKIIIHGRNQDKVDRVKKYLKNHTGNKNIYSLVADFTDFYEVEQMAKSIKREHRDIDIVVNNAGVFNDKREITVDGNEKTFQVNYLAHFLLTKRILKNLSWDNSKKIINVASVSHSKKIDFDNLKGEKSFSGHEAYELSKLCMIMFTFYLADRFDESDLLVNCLDPGTINTKLLEKGWGTIGEDVDVGAWNLIHLIEDVKEKTGQYFVNQKPTKPAEICYDKNIQKKLIKISNKLTG